MAQVDCPEKRAADLGHIPSIAPSRTSLSTVSRAGRLRLSQFREQYLCFTIDSFHVIENLLILLGHGLPARWCDCLRYYTFGLTYTSTVHKLYPNSEQMVLANIKRRLKIISPVAAFQLQTANLPISITINPIEPCKAQIFKSCLEGNIEMVNLWFKTYRASPFVVNQHGENLLHVSNIVTFRASD